MLTQNPCSRHHSGCKCRTCCEPVTLLLCQPATEYPANDLYHSLCHGAPDTSSLAHGAVKGRACAAGLGHDANGKTRLRAPAGCGWAGKVAGNPGVRPRPGGPWPAHLVQQWLQAHGRAPRKLRRIARGAIYRSTPSSELPKGCQPASRTLSQRSCIMRLNQDACLPGACAQSTRRQPAMCKPAALKCRLCLTTLTDEILELEAQLCELIGHLWT